MRLTFICIDISLHLEKIGKADTNPDCEVV